MVFRQFHLWSWQIRELFGNLSSDRRFQHSLLARYTSDAGGRQMAAQSANNQSQSWILFKYPFPQTWLAETWTTRGIPNCRHCHRLPVPGGCQVNARPESGGRGLWLSSWHLPRHLGPAAGEGNHSREWWWELDRYSPAAASSASHQPHIKWFLIAPTTFNISTSCSAIQSLQNSRTESTCNFILHTLKLTPCWW